MRNPSTALAAVLSLGLVGGLWCVPYVATHDGPNHLADCVLALRLDDPSSGLDRYLERGSPISSLGFQGLCAAAVPLLGWRWAYRLTTATIALIFALGYIYLARGIAGEEHAPFELAGFAVALPWSFYMGFFDNLLASALSLWVLGFVVRTPRPSKAQWAVLSGTLVVEGLVHVFSASLLGLSIAFVIAFRAPPKQRMRDLAITALVGFPAIMLALSSSGGADVGNVEWHRFAARFVDLADTFVGGPPARTWLSIGFALACLILALSAVARLDPVRRALALFGGLSLVAYLSSPYHLPSWAYFSPRIPFLGLAIAPLAVPSWLFDQDWKRRSAVLLVALSALSSIAWSASFHLRMEPLVNEALGGLEAPIHRDGPRLPMMLVREPKVIAEVEPLVMIGHLYLFDQGGIDPYLYADQPMIDKIIYKDKPQKLFGEFPARFVRESFKCAGQGPNCPPLDVQYEWLAIWGKRFQDVILFADDPAIRATFLERGYAIDFEKERLSILHAQSCHLDVRLTSDPPAPLGAPILLRVGRSKIDSPMVEQRIPAGVAVSSDGLSLAVEGPDCGKLWVEVSWVGSSSTGSSLQPACFDDLEGGRAFVEAFPSAPSEVRCRLSR